MSSAAITARFGAAVRNLRFRLGLSQEDLAERADLHRTYIAGIEAGGRNVTLKTIVRLAEALQVSTEELLAPRQAQAAAADEISGASIRGKVVDILLVEPNPHEVQLTRQAFREVKIANRLQVVSDGAEALEYLFGTGRYAGRPTTDLPTLALLNLDLPKLSGFEVLRRIKRDRRTRRIPVVVLTTSQNTSDIAQSRRLGAAGCIIKPVNFYNFTQVTPPLRFQWALFEPAAALPA